MIDALSAGLSGLTASKQRALANANNIANWLTPGYKTEETDTLAGPSGMGTRVDSVSLSSTMGNLVQTGNPTDLAIVGNGYFPLSGQNGVTNFTRDGSFGLDSQGRLVNSQGMVLQPQIQVPQNAENLQISNEGAVSAQVNGSTVQLGQIQLANFSNPGGLSRDGGNVLSATGASGMPQVGTPGSGGRGYVMSGYLEGSNVDIAQEMIGLTQEEIIIKANIAVIKTADEMQKELLKMK